MDLGSTISSNLKWEQHIDNILKKAQHRLCFLRMVRSFGLTTQIMLTFYRAAIESVLTFSITLWFGSITAKEKDQIVQIGKSCLPNLESLNKQGMFERAIIVSHDSSHPTHHLFDPLPSSRRFRSITTRTNRFSSSLFPLAIQSLSKQK